MNKDVHRNDPSTQASVLRICISGARPIFSMPDPKALGLRSPKRGCLAIARLLFTVSVTKHMHMPDDLARERLYHAMLKMGAYRSVFTAAAEPLKDGLGLPGKLKGTRRGQRVGAAAHEEAARGRNAAVWLVVGGGPLALCKVLRHLALPASHI